MSSFTDPLDVRKVNAREWELLREFRYDVGHEGSGDTITVPAGFITDFASVPRPFWILFPPDGKYTAAAVVHDYLYVVQTRTRKETDLIFLEAMGVLGVSDWKRRLMYRAVRLGGGHLWNRRAKKLKSSRALGAPCCGQQKTTETKHGNE